MWAFLHGCCNEITIFDEMAKIWKPKVDVSNKKPIPGKLKKRVHSVSKPLSRDCNEISQPLLQKEDGKDFEGRRYGNTTVEEKGAIRVKVVMTKQEAARLLSKSKDGGRLEFKDVARELMQIPANRVSVVFPGTSSDMVLDRIPEER